MSRVRNVGRQAAGDTDLISLRDLNNALAALPGQYIKSDRINQPQGTAGPGVVGLDANGRMGNQYLPTDIARTTLQSSGQTRAGSLLVDTTATVTGKLTAQSVDIASAATVGTTLAVTGSVTAAGLDVGVGTVAAGSVNADQINAETAHIPENTAPTLKVRALTADSIALTAGGLSADSLASTVGTVTAKTDLVAQRNVLATGKVSGTLVEATGTTGDVTAARDVVATNEVRGAKGTFAGNVGAATLNTSGKASLNSAEVTGGLTVNGTLTPNGGITGLTSLSATGTVQANILSSLSTVTAQGKGTFGSLQSNGALDVAGAVNGVTDLNMSGTLTLTGAGKKVVAPDMEMGAGTILNTMNLAKDMASDQVHLYLNNRMLRQRGKYFELYENSRWVPNSKAAGFYLRTPDWGGTAGQDIPHNVWTTVQFSISNARDANIYSLYSTNGIRVLADAEYMFTAKVHLTVMTGAHYFLRFKQNGSALGHTLEERVCGGIREGDWHIVTAATQAVIGCSANDYIQVEVLQLSSSGGTNWGSDVISDGFRQSSFFGSYIGQR